MAGKRLLNFGCFGAVSAQAGRFTNTDEDGFLSMTGAAAGFFLNAFPAAAFASFRTSGFCAALPPPALD